MPARHNPVGWWKVRLPVLGLALLCSSCAVQDAEAPASVSGPDYEAELALIEETRSAFQTVLKAGRYEDLGSYVTPATHHRLGLGAHLWSNNRGRLSLIHI